MAKMSSGGKMITIPLKEESDQFQMQVLPDDFYQVLTSAQCISSNFLHIGSSLMQ